MVNAVPLNLKPPNVNPPGSGRSDPEADMNRAAGGREHHTPAEESAASAPPVVGERRPNLASLQWGVSAGGDDDASRGRMHPEHNAATRDEDEASNRRRRGVR